MGSPQQNKKILNENETKNKDYHPKAASSRLMMIVFKFPLNTRRRYANRGGDRANARLRGIITFSI